MSITPGINIGHYNVLSRLGSGNMGDVYRALDKRLDRQVAIKTLPAAFSHNADRLSRFIREAKILASLNHPNIGAIYGMEEIPSGGMCLILELVDGVSLSEKLRSGALPLGDVLDICAGVAGALEAAHERGVIHRDLKPGNVMVTRRGGVKVLDFGLARQVKPGYFQDRTTLTMDRSAISDVELDATRSMTDDGLMVEGTPGYMSPEQVRGEAQDHRTDIFAFGCLLYECASGKRAFAGETPHDKMASILNDDPSLDLLPSEIPGKIRDILARCLNKDVDRRLENIGLARIELENLRGELVERPIERISSPNNLPNETSSFIGREKELAECAELLNSTGLLTLAGIGGCGKTRIALRLARSTIGRFPDGVWFVDLEPVSEPDRIAQTAASALGVKEESGKPLIDTLVNYLKDKKNLIVLDNCEHLLPECSGFVESLFGAGVGLKIVATSRESLDVTGERIYAVSMMSLPSPEKEGDAGEVAMSEAGRLFHERARMVDPEFEIGESNARSIAEICRRLDGIPLAIELAAIRVKVLNVEQIRSRLDNRFRLLSAGKGATLPRHQTLSAAIQWSYDHLNDEEQQLLRLLSTFIGGWTLSSATAVAADGKDEFAVLDILTRLADKSLIIVDRRSGREARYTMLETVREYAMEQLTERGELAEARERHYEYFLKLAQEIDKNRLGSLKNEWRGLLELDLANILSAHTWCGQAEERGDKGLRLVFAIRNYWLPSGFLELGLKTSVEALNRKGASEPTMARGKVLLTAGVLSYFTGRYSEAGKYLDECLAIMRENAEPATVSTTLTALALIALSQKQNLAAFDYLTEAVRISRAAGDTASLSSALNSLGDIYRAESKFEESIAAYEEALEHNRAAGNVEDAAVNLCNLGRVWVSRGDLKRSRQILAELVDLALKIGSTHVYGGMFDVASGLMMTGGDWGSGARIYGAADALLEQSNLHRDITDDLFLDPLVAGARQQLGEAKFGEMYNTGRQMNPEEAMSEIKGWLKI